jgi:vancomycin permeability regulator SanA
MVSSVAEREVAAEEFTGHRRPIATPDPPSRIGRRIVALALGIVALGATYYAFSFWQVWATGRDDQARAVDAIVVMGAAQYDGRPSPQLAARLDHVVELWSQGLAPVVVVTGGNQEGDRFTEAEASAQYLLERGVPDESIVREELGSTSYDSLAGARELLDESVDTVLIVTDPYHALRSRLIADEVGFDAYVSSAPGSVVTGTNELRRQLGEAAGVAVGRIIGFERLSGLTD